MVQEIEEALPTGLGIAMNYLVRRGYCLLEANEKAGAHSVRLSAAGRAAISDACQSGDCGGGERAADGGGTLGSSVTE